MRAQVPPQTISDQSFRSVPRHPELPRKRRVKEGGRLAHLPMESERMAASVPAFPTSLANAGKMPALLEAGASRMPASHWQI